MPHHVPLRLPIMTNTDQFPLLNAFKEFLRRLPLPVHYRDYLVHSTRIIQVRHPSISQLLTDDVQYDIVDDMQIAAGQPCQCAHLAKHLGVPLVQWHLFIRHPRLLRHGFRTDSRVLLQHGNNDAYPTWKTVRKSVVRSAREVLLKLPPERVADMQASAFHSTLLACAKRCWRAQHITAPWYIWEQKIRDIKEKWGHAWVFEGCDKSMGKIVATMVSITWHTSNTWEYGGKKGGFGRKGYVACTGGYECIMHNACIGGLGNTSSLPIVMINVVFENTPFWALGVYGRILKAPIPQYTAVYSVLYGRILRVYGRILRYLFAPCGCFK